MSPVQKMCKSCGRSIIVWNTGQTRCPKCQLARSKAKPPKAIKPKGKRTLAYERWRDEVAIPYLDAEYGRTCAACQGMRCGNQQLDVDHILNRGSHPSLRMSLDNVQYLGRYPCHIEKTDGINTIKGE